MPSGPVQRVAAGINAAIALLAGFGVSEEFLRFACVGLLGLVWDTGTVYALKSLVGLYVAGGISYVVASTANWALNRLWTFGGRQHAAAHIQWMRFLIANLIGFSVNRGTYFTLISLFVLCRNQPFIPIFAGSVAGLCFNYFLSKRFVFG